MAHQPPQPDHDPDDYQHFLDFVASNSIQGESQSQNQDGNSFLPKDELLAYFRQGPGNERLELLLQLVSGFNDERPGSDAILSEYAATFAILLMIKKGRFITEFVRYGLNDQKLPLLERPARFPRTVEGDDYFFESFRQRQWQFCPRKFIRSDIDPEIEPDCVIPIVEKKQIDRGDSATIYKVILHPSYDSLDPATANPRFKHTYVFKVFRGKYARESYNIERKAFRYLKRTRALGESIIGFYGGFKQGETYTIILEYADRGNLDRFLKDTAAPTNGNDIIQVWNSAFKIHEGLDNLHNIPSDEPARNNSTKKSIPIFRGWHQDIKPQNILVISGDTDSKYDCRFKLADLGTSHFRKYEGLYEISDGDSGGTKEYGAPECYRYSSFMDHTQRAVGQTVDIWSVGCIYCEFAVWMALGQTQLHDFRQSRMNETKAIPGHRDHGCFHNGDERLECVATYLRDVVVCCRGSDHVTKRVVENLIEDMLLEDPQVRPSAKQVSRKAQIIITKARASLEESRRHASVDSQGGGHQTVASQSSLHGSQFYGSSRRKGKGIALTPQHRYSKLDSPPSSPSEHSSITEGDVDTTPPAKADAQASAQTDIAPVLTERLTSLATDADASAGDRFDLTDSQHAEDDQLMTSMTKGSIKQSPPVPDVGSPAANTSHRQTTISPSSNRGQIPVSDFTSKSLPATSSPPAELRVPPHATLQDGMSWMLHKKQRQFTGGLDEEGCLDTLSSRDFVFLIDDAASMKPHWKRVVDTVQLMAYIVKKFDDNGIDLYFMRDDKHVHARAKKSSQLLPHLAGKKLAGTSDVSLRLHKIIQAYENELRDYRTSKKSKFLGRSGKQPKQLLVYVLTDGLWQPGCDAATPIKSMVRTLEEFRLPHRQVGIQFICFGSDPSRDYELNRLDSELNLSMDIVDTEPIEGNLFKMLLGSVDKFFDGDYQNRPSGGIVASP